MTTRQLAEATLDGPWWRCGACGSRMAFEVMPAADTSMLPCKPCGTWNHLPIRKATP